VRQRTETIGTLKACHEAMRVATEVDRAHAVDVEVVYCPACGSPLDWKKSLGESFVDCPACGSASELPCHLRFKVAAQMERALLEYERATNEAWAEQLRQARAMVDFASVPVAAVVREEPAPGWLKVFCLTCLGVVITSIVLMAMYFR
jgi:hypothetical protein